MTAAELREPPTLVLTTGGVAARLGISPLLLRTAELRGKIPPARRDTGTTDRYYLESDLPAIAAYFSSRVSNL